MIARQPARPARRGSTSLAGCWIACAILVAEPALALDFKSIGPDPAILYDAPTTRGNKVAIAPRGMPVEIVVDESDWVRVRDQKGELAWVERRALTDKRTVIANVQTVARAAPDDGAPAVFRLAPGVLVDLLDAPVNGFVHVRHRDGAAGWVRIGDLWGT